MSDFQTTSVVAEKVGRTMKRLGTPDWFLGVGIEGKGKACWVSVRVERGHRVAARRRLGVARGPIVVDGVPVRIVISKMARALAPRKRTMTHRRAIGTPTLTGMGFDLEGEPDFIVQEVRKRVRELAAYLPEGETRLVLKATIRHVAPKKVRARR